MPDGLREERRKEEKEKKRLGKFMDEDETSRGVHIGTVTNKSNSLLQLPSFSYVLITPILISP